MNKNELLSCSSSFSRGKRSPKVYAYFTSVVFCQLDVYDVDRVCGRNFNVPFLSVSSSFLTVIGLCHVAVSSSLTAPDQHIFHLCFKKKKKFNIYMTPTHAKAEVKRNTEKEREREGEGQTEKERANDSSGTINRLTVYYSSAARITHSPDTSLDAVFIVD